LIKAKTQGLELGFYFTFNNINIIIINNKYKIINKKITLLI